MGASMDIREIDSIIYTLDRVIEDLEIYNDERREELLERLGEIEISVEHILDFIKEAQV